MGPYLYLLSSVCRQFWLFLPKLHYQCFCILQPPDSMRSAFSFFTEIWQILFLLKTWQISMIRNSHFSNIFYPLALQTVRFRAASNLGARRCFVPFLGVSSLPRLYYLRQHWAGGDVWERIVTPWPTVTTVYPLSITHTNTHCSAVQCISHFAPLNTNIRCESPSSHSDSGQYDNDTYCSTGTCSSTRTAWDPRPSIPEKEKQEPETTDARNRRNSPRDRFDYWILSRIKSKKICTNITKNDDR